MRGESPSPGLLSLSSGGALRRPVGSPTSPRKRGEVSQTSARLPDINAPRSRKPDAACRRQTGITAASKPLQEFTMSKLALYVPLEAKPGKEKEVAEFLKSALPLVEAEPGTVTWFAIQEGPSSFAIFDTFNDESGRNAHLNGKDAAALMATASELLAKPPAIRQIDILADKLPR